MADHTYSVSPDTDNAAKGVAGTPKASGWYADRSSPTDQSYWDGQDWTAKRRWTGGGWVVVGDSPDEVADPSITPTHASGPRYSAKAGSPGRAPKPKSTGFSINVGLSLLVVCGIALMYGSVGPWVSVSGPGGLADLANLAGIHLSVNGIDPSISALISVNGWVTFIGGLLLVIFACFEMTSEEVQLSIFTTLIAAATAVFATYDVFRIVQRISQVPSQLSANVSVGWGLICVLSAAVVATLVALVRLLQR